MHPEGEVSFEVYQRDNGAHPLASEYIAKELVGLSCVCVTPYACMYS